MSFEVLDMLVWFEPSSTVVWCYYNAAPGWSPDGLVGVVTHSNMTAAPPTTAAALGGDCDCVVWIGDAGEGIGIVWLDW